MLKAGDKVKRIHSSNLLIWKLLVPRNKRKSTFTVKSSLNGYLSLLELPWIAAWNPNEFTKVKETVDMNQQEMYEQIKLKHSQGVSKVQLGKEYGVSPRTIGRILLRGKAPRVTLNHQFKVGDTLIGTPASNDEYNITTSTTKVKVTDILGDILEVKIVSSPNQEIASIKTPLYVRAQYFTKAS